MHRARTITLTLLAIASALMLAPSIAAHHGTAASYDQEKFITVTGVVTEFRWRNPHSSLHLDVTDETGKVSEYAIELASPALMSRSGTGWTRRTFKAGDKVTFRVHPSKTGSPVGECLFNCEVTVNGTKLTSGGGAGREGGRGPGGAEGPRPAGGSEK
jgi:hypothetical protein